MNFWQAVVESNTFNFAVLVLIFVLLFSKLNISQMIENIKNQIVQSIDRAKAEKEAADVKLKNAKDLASGVDAEIQTHIRNAQEKAAAIETQIIEKAHIQEKYIDKNVDNLIFAEEKNIGNSAIEKTMQKASETAKEKIKSLLSSTPDLHKKFIEESIRKI